MPSLGRTWMGSRSKKERVSMKLKSLKFASIALLAIIMVACGGRSENRKLKEAAAINNKMMSNHDSIYNVLEEQRVKVNARMESIGENDVNYKAYKSMARSLDRGFKLLSSWESSVVGVPGMEHDHRDGALHSHDHQNEATLKSMSDQEILDLQNAYSNRLDEVSQKIKELITTMEMYTKNDQ